MKKYAIIVAAGSGSRMGTSTPKQFLLLQGKPVLWFTINTFLDAFEDIEVVLVLPEDYMGEGEKIRQSASFPGRIHLAAGGKTRFHSVRNGLKHAQHPSIVFVHDGVRCLLTHDLIHRCYDMTLEHGNAVPALTSVDSIRIEKGGDNEILNRNKVKIIQTPQTFHSEVLKTAFEQDYQEFFTDEASVVERSGIKINLVEGEETNIKITRPLDILIAEKILYERGF